MHDRHVIEGARSARLRRWLQPGRYVSRRFWAGLATPAVSGRLHAVAAHEGELGLAGRWLVSRRPQLSQVTEVVIQSWGVQHKQPRWPGLTGTEGMCDTARYQHETACRRLGHLAVELEFRLAVQHPERLDPVRVDMGRWPPSASWDQPLM
jgi:hypothetical protein